MAFALVDSIQQVQAVTDPVTPSVNTTGADLLIAVVHEYEPGTPGTISDSKSNSWTPLTAYIRSGYSRVRMYYSVPTSVGSGHTVTYTATSIYAVVTFMAFSGSHASSPFNKESGAGLSGTTAQPGSVTPDQNDSLLVTAIAWSTEPNSPVIDEGFSSPVYIDYDSGTAERGGGVSYLIQTTAAAANPTWTFDTTGEQAVTIAVFKPGAGGGGGGGGAQNVFYRRRR
jgi:hypothetical protein